MGNGIWYGAAGVVVLVALIVVGHNAGWYDSWFEKEQQNQTTTTTPPPVVIISGSQPQASDYVPPVTAPQVEGRVPVEQLNGLCKNKFTMAAVTTGNFSFYSVGADVSDPYVLELDSIDCGTNTTAMVIQTNAPYDLYYQHNSGATYYDAKIDNWDINYNPSTGKGYLMIGGAAYFGVSPVGAFVDVDTLPSVQTGCIGDNGTDSINYSEGGCGSSAWFQVDIGNANANTEIQNMVMCFVDGDGDMDGNEVTAVTAAYVSGSTAISIPGSLQQYWEDAMGGGGSECIKIANLVGSSQKARWEFTITVSEANWDSGEEFEIVFDDLGDYLAKQYPSRNAKATAESLEIENNA